jgi:hypothetical protein
VVPIKNVSPNKTLKAGVRAIRTARWITPRTSEHVVLKSLLVSLHCDTHVIFRCGFAPYISVYTFFDLRRSVRIIILWKPEIYGSDEPSQGGY